MRADERGVDGWCVGVVDPLGKGENAEVVLVDAFAFRVAGGREAGSGEGA